MPYEIQDDSGKYVGPYDDDDIEKWVDSGQVHPEANIRDYSSGFVSKAGRMSRQYMAQQQARIPVVNAPAPKSSFKDLMTSDEGVAEMVGAVFFSIMAIALALFVGRIGVGAILGAAIYAYRSGEKGYDHVNVAYVMVALAGVISLAVGFLVHKG